LVALESLRGDHPLVSFAHRFDVHPNLVRAWQSQLLCKAARLFDEPRQTRPRQRLRLVGAATTGTAVE
jgi:transposase-like protein